MSSGFRYTTDSAISRWIKIWLVAGLIMIWIQVVIGGITRLTGSGLSITKWEIVTGAIPPIGHDQWATAFEAYQQTPQYHKINEGMTLDAFQFIYFWEYFHRLWARLMFVVFILPFMWFWATGMFSKRLVRRLAVVVLLAGLEGFFGWIMVASGLIQRPWVNAYNLTLHLCMALVIFSYLLWTTFLAFQPFPQSFENKPLKRYAWVLVGCAFLQIAFGAMMSGTKAGLFFPTWPDMNGSYLPGILLDGSQWTSDSFIHYDTNPFMPAFIQFLHRNTAYLLTLLVLDFYRRMYKQQISALLRKAVNVLLVVLSTQILLGIFTLINCKAKVPVDLGVAHQACAVILLGILLFISYQIQKNPRTSLKLT